MTDADLVRLVALVASACAPPRPSAIPPRPAPSAPSAPCSGPWRSWLLLEQRRTALSPRRSAD